MAQQLTFIDLIKRYRIEIPRIQRDYAQGRLSEQATDIRKSIVDTIVSVLDKNSKRVFNFIYGSTNNDVFIPLDGQQRLTTLFLFHLYLEGIASANKEDIVTRDYKFSYTTRKSSDLFCQELIKNKREVMKEVHEQYDIYNQIENEKKEKKKKSLDEPIPKEPSAIIRNQSWFFPQWDDDPTIAGMLVMLDEIHSRYVGNINKAINAYECLFKEKAISFQFQSLNNFTRTDDLFIKMNSRGLELNDFEIFKSKLVEDFEKSFRDKESEFKQSIDGKWCDFLWKLRSKVKGKDDVAKHNIDIIYQRLLKYIIPAEAAALGQSISKYADELFERNNMSMRFSHNSYLKYNVEFSTELLKRLYEDFSYIFSETTSPLTFYAWPLVGYFKVNADIEANVDNPFSALLLDGEQPTYHTSVMLYAWLRFKIIDPDEIRIEKWVRTICHVVRDSNVDSSEGLINAIRSVNKLLDKYSASGKDVYEWLSDLKINDIKDLTGLSSYQLQEEVVKAQLRLRDSSWNDVIEYAEEDDFMEGQIGFILESSGIANSIDDDRFVLNENPSNENLYNIFIEYLEKAKALFANLKPDNDIIKEHLLVRALLKHGDYLIKTKSWDKYQIANSRTDRDYSWHAIINIGRKHKNSREIFKSLLDDNDFDCSNVKSSLETIASRDISDAEEWRQILSGINGHKILERSHKGFFNIQKDDNDKVKNIRILHTSQLNGFHDELYSLLIYFMLLPEFKGSISYDSVKSGQEDAGIIVHDSVKITHWDNEWIFIYPNEWDKPKEENRSCSIKDFYRFLLTFLKESN